MPMHCLPVLHRRAARASRPFLDGRSDLPGRRSEPLLPFRPAATARAAMFKGAIHAGAPAAGVAVDELLSRPLALVVALALVSLLPFVFMTLTSFVKICTVLQIVRG